MNFLAFLFEKPVVDHLLGQGVLEHILQIWLKGPGPDQIEALKRTQPPIDAVFELCDPFENLVKKSPPDHRSLLNNALCLLFQSIKPAGNKAMDRRGYVRFSDGSCDFPTTIVSDQRLRFDQGIDQLFQIKGISFCLILNKSLQIRRNGLGLKEGFQHILCLRKRKILKSNLLVGLANAGQLITRE